MRSINFFCTKLLAALCAAVLFSGASAHAIGGCSSKRTGNPDNSGPAGTCNSSAMRGCADRCRSANACYARQTPPLTTIPAAPAPNPCQAEQNLLTECLSSTMRGSLGAPTTARVTVNQMGRCTTVEQRTRSASITVSQTRTPSVVVIETPEQCDTDTIDSVALFFGVPSDTLRRTTSLRGDLGLADGELQQFAYSLGNAHQIQIDPSVLQAVDTIGQLASCISTVKAELGDRR